MSVSEMNEIFWRVANWFYPVDPSTAKVYFTIDPGIHWALYENTRLLCKVTYASLVMVLIAVAVAGYFIPGYSWLFLGGLALFWAVVFIAAIVISVYRYRKGYIVKVEKK